MAESSIMNLLGSGKCGKVGVLVVGGAAESLKCEPGIYKIIIKNRKGFVRVALKAGYVESSNIIENEYESYIISH